MGRRYEMTATLASAINKEKAGDSP